MFRKAIAKNSSLADMIAAQQALTATAGDERAKSSAYFGELRRRTRARVAALARSRCAPARPARRPASARCRRSRVVRGARVASSRDGDAEGEHHGRETKNLEAVR